MRNLGLFLVIFGLTSIFLAILLLIIGLVNNNNQLLLILAAVGLTSGILMLVFGIQMLVKNPPVQVSYSNDPGRYIPKQVEERELDGTTYTVQFIPPTTGKHAQPSRLILTTRIDLDGEFEIVPESAYDRIAKSWNLATEIQTQDESFDENYFIRSDTVAFTEALLSFPQNRLIIADLHRIGFKSVQMKNHELKVTWVGFDPKVHDSPELTEEVGARLILLARKTPSDLPPADTQAANRRVRAQLVLWPLVVLFGLLIFAVAVYKPMSGGELMLRALVLMLGVIPVSLLVAAYALSGTSRSHYAWGTWVIGAAVGLPLGCVGTIALINGTLDESPPIIHKVNVLRKYTTRNKNNTNYHLECESWRDDGETDRWSINRRQYDQVVIGQSRYVVTTRGGYLGLEWIVSRGLE